VGFIIPTLENLLSCLTWTCFNVA